MRTFFLSAALLALLVACGGNQDTDDGQVEQPLCVDTMDGDTPVNRADFMSDEWPYGDPDSIADREALIDDGVLYDDMPACEAHAILGPPTSQESRDTFVLSTWHYAPNGHDGPTALFTAHSSGGMYSSWSTNNH